MIINNNNIIVRLNTIDHFTVACLVAWPLSESEAGVDFILIQIFLFFTCKSCLLA